MSAGRWGSVDNGRHSAVLARDITSHAPVNDRGVMSVLSVSDDHPYEVHDGDQDDAGCDDVRPVQHRDARRSPSSAMIVTNDGR